MSHKKTRDNSKQKQKRKNKPLASPTYDGSFVPFLPQRSATTNSMWNTRNRRSRHLLFLSFYFFVFVGSAIRYMSSCIIIAVHHNLKTKQNRRRAEKRSRRSAHTIALEFGIRGKKNIIFIMQEHRRSRGGILEFHAITIVLDVYARCHFNWVRFFAGEECRKQW